MRLPQHFRRSRNTKAWDLVAIPWWCAAASNSKSRACQKLQIFFSRFLAFSLVFVFFSQPKAIGPKAKTSISIFLWSIFVSFWIVEICSRTYLSDASCKSSVQPDLWWSARQKTLQSHSHPFITSRTHVAKSSLMPHPSSSEAIARWIPELAKAKVLILLQQTLALVLQCFPAWLFSKELMFIFEEPQKLFASLDVGPLENEWRTDPMQKNSGFFSCFNDLLHSDVEKA